MRTFWHYFIRVLIVLSLAQAWMLAVAWAIAHLAPTWPALICLGISVVLAAAIGGIVPALINR